MKKALKVILIILGGIVISLLPALIWFIKAYQGKVDSHLEYNAMPFLTAYIIVLVGIKVIKNLKTMKVTPDTTGEKPKVQFKGRKQLIQDVEDRRAFLRTMDYNTLRNEPLTLMIQNYSELGGYIFMETEVQGGLLVFRTQSYDHHKRFFFDYDLLIPLVDGTVKQVSVEKIGLVDRAAEKFCGCVKGDHVSFAFAKGDVTFENIQRYGIATPVDYRVTDDELARVYKKILNATVDS